MTLCFSTFIRQLLTKILRLPHRLTLLYCKNDCKFALKANKIHFWSPCTKIIKMVPWPFWSSPWGLDAPCRRSTLRAPGFLIYNSARS